MVSLSKSLGWQTALSVVIACVLNALPLAAQDRGRFLDQDAAESQRQADVIVSSPGAPATTDAVIEEMSQAAGVIFAGQVAAVRRPAGFAGSSEDAAEGVVEVDFQVDQAVRGPASGSVYTVREWAGLWNGSAGGGDRYRVGQRLLMFLHEPDAQGLSSPVRGRDGAVPLRGGGVAPGPDDTTASAAQWMVDLRWIQALALRGGELVITPIRRPIVPRPIGFVPRGEAEKREELGPPLVRRVRIPAPQAPEIAPVETQPLTQVLAMCVQAIRRADVAR